MNFGQTALLRSIYRGRVRFTIPHHVVADDASRLVLYRRPGSVGRTVRRDADGRYLDRWARGDPTTEFIWSRTHMLVIVNGGESHSLDLFWDESWSFLGWYVNLQSPLRRSPSGFDMTDWALDVWVEPDGRWEWKDEEDLAEAKRLGVLDDDAAAAVRAEGERVIAARPWPTGWEDWRPPVEWEALLLPDGWDVVA